MEPNAHNQISMNIPVKIPLNRIQQSINKIELTHIDRFLTGDQKKRVASFYREEAAKRTHYQLEPAWTIPESVYLVKTYQPEPIIADPKEVKDSMPRKMPNQRLTKNLEEPEVPSSPDTIVTDSDDIKPVDTEALEIGTSPLNSLSSRGSPENSPESDSIQDLLAQLLKKNRGSYTEFKKDVLTMRKFTKAFGDISNTQLKKLVYQEKTRQIKDLRKHHQQ